MANKHSWSIAARLVVLFTISSTLLLIAAAGALYGIVVHKMNGDSDRFFEEKLADVRGDLTGEAGTNGLLQELRAVRPGKEGGYWLRLTDSKGGVIAETPRMGDYLPASIFPQSVGLNAKHGEPVKYRAADGKRFALISANIRPAGRIFVIQIAQNRSRERAFAANFRALLAGVVAWGALASAGIAAAVTRRGLRPLGKMAASVESIRATRLHVRLPAEGWPGELAPLTLAFNEMLVRLEDSFARLSQFSADIAHELRTPITNLRGEAEVSLSKARTADEYRQVIESSAEEYGRLSGMIDSLLFLARSESPDASIGRSAFDAVGAVAAVIGLYEDVALEHGVSLACTGEGTVSADPLLFRRAIDNLVSNALRHTPRGGGITVAVAARADATEICVTDTGCGIASEHLPRVFDRLYRADSARGSPGAGLGLAIVKSIMRLHGGAASIQSEPGVGTAVTLAFPAA